MMERILLGVFCLSGWHIFSSCLLHQYHYVADPMNWTEAQTYCRETYTDLATIENIEETNHLINTVNTSSFGNNTEVWIGLYRNTGWRWSDGYRGSGADYRNWPSKSPFYGTQICVLIIKGNPWSWDFCSRQYTFICDNGTQQDPEFVYINENMDWSSAQRYCRENFRDLATVRNKTEEQEIMSMVPSKQWQWIGLFVDPNTYWSDGSNSSFRYMEEASSPSDLIGVGCGVADLNKSGKWRIEQCERTLPFVCYSTPPVRSRQVVKLRIQVEDSVNLNDPVVKADILKKLQDRLTEKEGSGVTLKWREQSDGTVFRKEGEHPQEKEKKKTEL